MNIKRFGGQCRSFWFICIFSKAQGMVDHIIIGIDTWRFLAWRWWLKKVWSAMPIGRWGHWCANIFAHQCPPQHYYWRTDGFIHRVGRVLSFSPVVGIGTSSTPHLQVRMAPLWFRGELHTRLRERGGRVPIPTRGHKLWYSTNVEYHSLGTI